MKGLIRLLGLDEPLSALDGVIKESIKELIRRIAREYRLTSCSLI